jgi:uncharacterized Zn-binding protein involved in type VI secretion
MAPAARVGDQSSHPGVITGPGVATVLIAGMPAAIVGDLHACAFPPPSPHPSTPIAVGSSTVLIGGRPGARIGDSCGCGAAIVMGAPTVLVGG